MFFNADKKRPRIIVPRSLFLIDTDWVTDNENNSLRDRKVELAVLQFRL